jgi:hypothetical protein
MTLKLSREQHEALLKLFERIVSEPVVDIKDSLVIDLLKPILVKLKSKQALKCNNHGWNLSVTPIQAKSYYAFFEGRFLGPHFIYEQIIIEKHLKAIDKIFA